MKKQSYYYIKKNHRYSVRLQSKKIPENRCSLAREEAVLPPPCLFSYIFIVGSLFVTSDQSLEISNRF